MDLSVRIFLDTHLADFSDQQRGLFIQKLEEVTGEPLADYKDVKFVDGCVTFSGKPSPEALERLLEAYRQRNLETDDPLHAAIRDLINECGVTGIDFGPVPHRRSRSMPLPPKEQDPLIVFVHGYTGD